MQAKPWAKRSDYTVRDNGQVTGPSGRGLKGKRDKDGYIYFTIVVDGKTQTVKRARMILETFVGPCPEGKQSRHLNSVRDDDRLSNLAWGTPREDGQDRRGQRNIYNVGNEYGKRKITHGDVIAMRERAANGELVSEFALEYGITQAYARRVVNGSVWKKLPNAIKRRPRGKLIAVLSSVE